ncbi:MAG TPA: WGxxGxxG family protein [Bryobacteraceae bacterium]|nr:WGxxGxxG family protein [Bryobacteraceae bacterium]
MTRLNRLAQRGLLAVALVAGPSFAQTPDPGQTKAADQAHGQTQPNNQVESQAQAPANSPGNSRMSTGQEAQQAGDSQNERGGFDLGWMGLLGLAGLVGLLPRKKAARPVANTDAEPRTY